MSCTKKIYNGINKKIDKLENTISIQSTVIDCMINSPVWVESDEIGFNGQKHRKKIFKDLIEACNFNMIIETGAYLGNTTGYMVQTSGLPVHTCELNPLFNSITRSRLKNFKNITLQNEDSRLFLRNLSIAEKGGTRVFIYLDAHWEHDLPLAEEIEIICNTWTDFVIMVDDFQVPGDAGYGYDNYGKGKELSLQTFSEAFSKHNLLLYFPSLPSEQENGYKRGSVILVKKGTFGELLSHIPSLVKKG